MARKYNVMPVVKNVNGLNIVNLGEFGDKWSVRHGKYVVDCLECGVYFLTDRPHTKYHSKACRQKAHRRRASEREKAYAD